MQEYTFPKPKGVFTSEHYDCHTFSETNKQTKGKTKPKNSRIILLY